jgi:xanthine dehydrogenase YagS FAD-binding subunit
MATLAQLPATRWPGRYGALAQPRASRPAPDRHVATLGGNLLQRRAAGISARCITTVRARAAASRFPANQYHAIFARTDARSCIRRRRRPRWSPDARVELIDARGARRVVALERSSWLLMPTCSENVEVGRNPDRGDPAADDARRVFDTPAAGQLDSLTGRSPTSRRSTSTATALPAGVVVLVPRPVPYRPGGRIRVDRQADHHAAARRGDGPIAGATPLTKNAYKVPVFEALVRWPSRRGGSGMNAGRPMPGGRQDSLRNAGRGNEHEHDQAGNERDAARGRHGRRCRARAGSQEPPSGTAASR